MEAARRARGQRWLEGAGVCVEPGVYDRMRRAACVWRAAPGSSGEGADAQDRDGVRRKDSAGEGAAGSREGGDARAGEHPRGASSLSGHESPAGRSPSVGGENCGACRLVVPSDVVKPKIADCILKDVPRSFGSMLFQYDSPEIKSDLTEVLLAFSIHNKAVGYTQGMNFIALVALLHMEPEETFWFLDKIAASLPRKFFSNAAKDEVVLFGEIVSNYAPIIKSQIELAPGGRSDPTNYVRGIGYLLVQWMVPLFVHAVPLETAFRMWDFLFRQVDPDSTLESTLVLNLHRIAFSLLEIHSGPLLSKHRQISKNIQEYKENQELLHRKIRNVTDEDSDDDEVRSLQVLDRNYYEFLTNSQEQTIGVELLQRVLASASKDSNGDRIISLAKEVTIQPEWLDHVRLQKLASRTNSAYISNRTSQPMSATRSMPQLIQAKDSDNPLGCILTKGKLLDLVNPDRNSSDQARAGGPGKKKDDCIIA